MAFSGNHTRKAKETKKTKKNKKAKESKETKKVSNSKNKKNSIETPEEETRVDLTRDINNFLKLFNKYIVIKNKLSNVNTITNLLSEIAKYLLEKKIIFSGIETKDDIILKNKELSEISDKIKNLLDKLGNFNIKFDEDFVSKMLMYEDFDFIKTKWLKNIYQEFDKILEKYKNKLNKCNKSLERNLLNFQKSFRKFKKIESDDIILIDFLYNLRINPFNKNTINILKKINKNNKNQSPIFFERFVEPILYKITFENLLSYEEKIILLDTLITSFLYNYPETLREKPESLFLYDKIIDNIFEIINSIVNECYKIDSIEEILKFSLIKNLVFLCDICNINKIKIFLGVRRFIDKLKNRYKVKTSDISKNGLELKFYDKFKGFIRKKFKSKADYIIQSIETQFLFGFKDKIHEKYSAASIFGYYQIVDFSIGSCILEIDGPSHFFIPPKSQVRESNSKTTIRNEIAKNIISTITFELEKATKELLELHSILEKEKEDSNIEAFDRSYILKLEERLKKDIARLSKITDKHFLTIDDETINSDDKLDKFFELNFEFFVPKTRIGKDLELYEISVESETLFTEEGSFEESLEETVKLKESQLEGIELKETLNKSASLPHLSRLLKSRKSSFVDMLEI